MLENIIIKLNYQQKIIMMYGYKFIWLIGTV